MRVLTIKNVQYIDGILTTGAVTWSDGFVAFVYISASLLTLAIILRTVK